MVAKLRFLLPGFILDTFYGVALRYLHCALAPCLIDLYLSFRLQAFVAHWDVYGVKIMDPLIEAVYLGLVQDLSVLGEGLALLKPGDLAAQRLSISLNL